MARKVMMYRPGKSVKNLLSLHNDLQRCYLNGWKRMTKREKGYFVKFERVTQGVTRVRASEAAGMTVHELQQFEAGHLIPDHDAIVRLAGMLNINPEFFDGDSEEIYRSDDIIHKRLTRGASVSIDDDDTHATDFMPLDFLVSVAKSCVITAVELAIDSDCRAALYQEHRALVGAVAVLDGSGNLFVFSKDGIEDDIFILDYAAHETLLETMPEKLLKDVSFSRIVVDCGYHGRLTGGMIDKDTAVRDLFESMYRYDDRCDSLKRKILESGVVPGCMIDEASVSAMVDSMVRNGGDIRKALSEFDASDHTGCTGSNHITP